MENAKQMATPMSTACYLDKDEVGQSVHIKKYRGIDVNLTRSRSLDTGYGDLDDATFSEGR